MTIVKLPPPRFFKFVFSALLIALAFAATYTSSAAAFSESDFRQIVLFGGAVNAVLLLGALLCLRSKLIANVALSLVVLAGVATAYIIHTDLYSTGNRVVLILLCAASAAGLLVAFQVMDEARWSGVALSAGALLGLGVIAGGYRPPAITPVEGDTTNIRDIFFRETPNLYFVSFDALAPRALLDKHLNLETTEFHELFEANFRRFPNFFANSVMTGHSLNTLLALDVDVYISLRRELAERGDDHPFLFSGHHSSPLLGILRKNGYETTSTYVDDYFGSGKGPYIDNYITFVKNSVCNLLADGIRDWAFWGYCRFFDGSFDWDTRLVAEQITKVSAGDGPQFVIAYIYAPGHTGKSFRYDNADQLEKFKAQHINDSARAARYLELILRHLEENDPGAILFVFGDHGPYLSRGMDYVEANREFIIQDLYGILGGIYPRDTCAAYFDEISDQGYMTILDAVHAILRCLSGGESAFIEPRAYTRPAYGIPEDAKSNYKEVLYE